MFLVGWLVVVIAFQFGFVFLWQYEHHDEWQSE
jgi:hypothetical protein